MTETIPDVSARRAVRQPNVSWSQESPKRVTLRRRKFGAFGTAVLRFARIPPDLTVHLDPLGSAAWLLMDGRSVADIRKGLEGQFPQEADLAARLGKFLGVMVSRDLVRLE